MSFVLKYGLSIALAMLLVGCPDDENEKEGTVTLSIKKIDNVAAGEGDNASVSVEVTIKDGDDKVTGDDAKAKVSLKHKCGSADEYSGSGEATAANAVAKPSIDVPRPAADAKGDTHKCKIQASAKIGDKDITAESNEFTVAKKGDSKTTDVGTEEANLKFKPDIDDITVGAEFTVENSGGKKGTIKLKSSGCDDLHLVTVGTNTVSVGSSADIAKKTATDNTSVTFAIAGTGSVSDCKLEGVAITGTGLVARSQGGGTITGIASESSKLQVTSSVAPAKLFVKKDDGSPWVMAEGTLAASHTFDNANKGGDIAYDNAATTAKALAKFATGGWFYLADQ